VTSTLAYVALALTGVATGVLNTMAGGGALLVLPLLVGLGLPAGVANGTMRLGVLAQNLGAVLTFHRLGVGARAYGAAARLAAPMLLGALAGARLCTLIPDRHLKPAFGAVFLLWALLLLLRPGAFRAKEVPSPRPVGPAALLLSLCIGLYGGFMQAGVGFPLLALLISFLGNEPIVANAIKVVLVLIYTVAVVPVFVLSGKVAWVPGLILALGSILGGFLGARIHKRVSGQAIRFVVLFMVAVSGLLMLLR
jgi:hypothetical protein